MLKQGTRVLGVDTSLRSTGVAVVEMQGTSLTAVDFGTLKNSRTASLTDCLKALQRGIIDMIERTGAVAAAVEGAFFHKNAKTAMILGEARGVAICACSAMGLPVYEYAPRKVKQAVVGTGSAGKEQVSGMVMTLLNLESMPQEDAGDALAIAICHLHTHSGYAELAPKAI